MHRFTCLMWPCWVLCALGEDSSAPRQPQPAGLPSNLTSAAAAPSCSLWSGCRGLGGDCCPAPDGMRLACCDAPDPKPFPVASTIALPTSIPSSSFAGPSCSLWAGCRRLSGDCCPAPDGMHLACCDVPDPEPVPIASTTRSFLPFRGICYAPLPCLSSVCGAPENMAQEGYEPQWGAAGRDDLSIMKRMGANIIRLYHPIGERSRQPNSSAFLDASERAGLKVFGAVHQYLSCTAEDDCYESWFKAVRDGLASGFAKGGAWHPAVWAINLINEVDAHVPFTAPARQVKRIISAVDALLVAEKESKVTGSVNLTSCFTTAIAPPLGGGPWTVYHGFSSIEDWIRDPSLVQYTPRSGSLADLVQAIDKRWVHCVNVQIPWENGLKGMLADNYAPMLPRPWFIGEMGFNGAHSSIIESELKAMHAYAEEGNGFLGTFFFQFQTAYFKWGSELNFGMFGLGAAVVDADSCLLEGKEFQVHCLTSRQWAFEQPSSGCKDDCNFRAKAVAKAFGGEIGGRGVCLDAPPLGQQKVRRLRYDAATSPDLFA